VSTEHGEEQRHHWVAQAVACATHSNFGVRVKIATKLTRNRRPDMAIVILGGLVTSTALNLLVLPTLALRLGKFDKRNPST
jgi:hypothetical protein